MSSKKKKLSTKRIDNFEDLRTYESDKSSNDIDDMINERRKNTEELSKELEIAKEEYNKEILEKTLTKKIQLKKETNDDLEESLAKTQILELTRQMKFNFEDVKSENTNKKNGITLINIIGIINLICIGFYIYLLTFTNYQDNKNNYLIVGSIIVLLVLFFGLSVVTSKKLRKVFNIFNILTILAFISFNIYILI